MLPAHQSTPSEPSEASVLRGTRPPRSSVAEQGLLPIRWAVTGSSAAASAPAFGAPTAQRNASLS